MIRRLVVAVALSAAFVFALADLAPAVAATAAADAAATAAAQSPTGSITTAQPLGSTYVNLSPFVALVWQVALAILPPLILALIAFGVSFIKNKTGIEISKDAQVGLERAFTNGVNMATVRLQTTYGGKLTLDVHNALAATVVNYVIDHAPEELKKLGIDPTKAAATLAEKAIARLAGAGIVPPSDGQALTVKVPAVPVAAGIGLVTGRDAAPASAPVLAAVGAAAGTA
jgi:hypothetical protein